MADEFAELRADIKALRKELRRVKALLEDPNGEKAAARSTNNGFNTPLDISEELRAFLKLAPGEKISRSQVTKKINEYVSQKGLKDKQEIKLDNDLKVLLNPPDGTKVTFLNIQRYINQHYIKAPAAPKEKKAAAPKEAPAPKEKKAAAKPPTVKKAATKA